MIVAELERALLARYPKTDAEGWDHVGLSVGDPAAEITGVACALDATEANVRRAQEAGANVLLTHHPVYIKAPEAFCPVGYRSPPVQRGTLRGGPLRREHHLAPHQPGPLARSPCLPERAAGCRTRELTGARGRPRGDRPGRACNAQRPVHAARSCHPCCHGLRQRPACVGRSRSPVPHRRHFGRLPGRLWRARHRRRVRTLS